MGREKKPEREEKEVEERSGRKVGPGLNGAELPAMSPTEPRSSAPGMLVPRRVSSMPASMVPS